MNNIHSYLYLFQQLHYIKCVKIYILIHKTYDKYKKINYFI